MSCSAVTAPPTTLRMVTISYSQLKDKDAGLTKKIEDGFGPNGLGILSISDVPGFFSLRQNLLHLAPRLANLPEEVKRELEDPHSRFNFGRSHGKEKLESGTPDMLKGSFYANPIYDTPTTDASLIQRAFKSLGKLILDVGLMVAYHCDQYVSKMMKLSDDEALENVILHSRCQKGRLLYYFPVQQRSYLCMFMRDSVELPCPDAAAGLYVKTRADQIVKVTFGKDEIAYQIGETTEILSRGLLCATPHCVRAPNGEKAFGVERSTFALFIQSDWDEILHFPQELHLHKELIQPNGTLTFGEYSEKLIDKYYHVKPQ